MINIKNISCLNWDKVNGMIPAIIQNYQSGEILMHGYMNVKSLKKTIETKLVTFFSRTKQKIWTKGETSGNFLKVVKIFADCDLDTLLFVVHPSINTCHKGYSSCFKYIDNMNFNFLNYLENYLIKKSKDDIKKSYTAYIYNSGTKRISQKVAEEGIEVALAAMTIDDINNNKKLEIINESADLIYHLLILLQKNKIKFFDVIKILKYRNKLKNK